MAGLVCFSLFSVPSALQVSSLPGHGFPEGRQIPDTELPALTVLVHLCPRVRPRASYKRRPLLPQSLSEPLQPPRPSATSSVVTLGPHPLLLCWLLPQLPTKSRACLHQRHCLHSQGGRLPEAPARRSLPSCLPERGSPPLSQPAASFASGQPIHS